jgi:hypothetical protein
VKTDPTDTGGLFVRRRPGTAPVRYRELPDQGTARRQRADGLLAHGFVALLAMLFGGLVALKRIDQAWILVRRAAGVDQRSGVLPLVFGVTAVVGATLFAAWLLLVGGLGPSISPTS